MIQDFEKDLNKPTSPTFISLPSSYSESEYESDDSNDLDYKPCYYYFCDESSDYKCDECGSELCIDHIYKHYLNDDNLIYCCKYCLANMFDQKISLIEDNLAKQNERVEVVETRICDIYLSMTILTIGFVGYYLLVTI